MGNHGALETVWGFGGATMKTPPPEYTEREERIAIKIDSHIPENEAIRQTDEEMLSQKELFSS
jgi:hypothetical protein